MKILNNYIAKTLLKYCLSVMIILVVFFSFLKFLEEIKNVGADGHTLANVSMYVLLLVPSLMYSLYSFIILLGCMLGLSYLAASSELIVMRSSGVSIVDISKIVITLSAVFVIIMLVFGEFIAIPSYDYAKKNRDKSTGVNVTVSSYNGFWIKDKNSFINVGKNIGGKVFNNVTLVKLTSANNLDSIAFSDKALFDGKKINMQDANYYKIDANNSGTHIENKTIQKHVTAVNFDTRFIDSLAKDPKLLSVWQLFAHIDFLFKNNLASDVYKAEFYQRLVKPFTLITMIILAIPFVFGSLRDASLGKKVFAGLLISLFFDLTSRIGGMISIRFGFSHLLSASLPTIVAFLVAVFLLYRVAVR